jgi:hypothetical protein
MPLNVTFSSSPLSSNISVSSSSKLALEELPHTAVLASIARECGSAEARLQPEISGIQNQQEEEKQGDKCDSRTCMSSATQKEVTSCEAFQQNGNRSICDYEVASRKAARQNGHGVSSSGATDRNEEWHLSKKSKSSTLSYGGKLLTLHIEEEQAKHAVARKRRQKNTIQAKKRKERKA